MARPPTYDFNWVTVPLRMPPDLHERIAVAAAERGLSVSILAKLAFEDYLDRLIPIDELVLTRPPTEGP